jgi:hypothetical protein
MSYFPDHPNLKVGDLVRYDMRFPRQRELWRIEPEGLAVVIDLIGSRYVKLKVFGRDKPICLLARDAGITICNSPKENAS